MTPETIKSIAGAVEAVLTELNTDGPFERAHQEAIAAMQKTVDRLNYYLGHARWCAAQDVLYLAENGQTEIEFGKAQRVFISLLNHWNSEGQISPAYEFTLVTGMARHVLEQPMPTYDLDE